MPTSSNSPPWLTLWERSWNGLLRRRSSWTVVVNSLSWLPGAASFRPISLHGQPYFPRPSPTPPPPEVNHTLWHSSQHHNMCRACLPHRTQNGQYAPKARHLITYQLSSPASLRLKTNNTFKKTIDRHRNLSVSYQYLLCSVDLSISDASWWKWRSL